MAGVSFVDDLHPLPAVPRLLTHGLGAVLLTVAGVQDRELPPAGRAAAGVRVDRVVTNVYNFMDGIDGLAASARPSSPARPWPSPARSSAIRW